MKRVNCLYRVSTLGQVDVTKVDIPMQKIACHEFAERQGWVITEEFTEKGISGSKVHADKRDAIQRLKQNAINKEFDVLLVFMFDRIGRIDDETPFIVEWFVQQGIEVWSVQEGEQRFDTHVDKLMNYIRFWQAAGESAKTSERIRTRMRQLTEEGIFAKGVVPFGYKLEKRGRVNKKGYDVCDLVINDEEAEYVRRIFDETVRLGYGSHIIANELNAEGIRTHKGSEFNPSNIKRILKSKLYCGYIVGGGVSSPKLEEITIIDEDLWERAQEIVKQREKRYEERRNVSLRTQSENLLAGNIYCGHCGARITYSATNKKYTKIDGTEAVYRIRRYNCSRKANAPKLCAGRTSYTANKIDDIVLSVVHDLFNKITDVPQAKAVERKIQSHLNGAKAEQKRASMQLERLTNQYQKLQLEIAASLTGESNLSVDDLSVAIKTIKEKIAEAEKQLEEANETVEKGNQSVQAVVPMYNRFVSWANTFDEMPVEEKRTVLSQLIERIEVRDGFDIEITLNMDYEQFCKDWNSNTDTGISA